MKFLLTVLSGLILFCSSPAQAQFSNGKYVEVSLAADTAQVQGGDTVTLGVVEKIFPGWHVYWINPGDSGEPARLVWEGIPGAVFHPVQWPTPKKIATGPLTSYGYENNVTLLQDMTLPTTLPAGEITLRLNATILVCADICIPEEHTATLTFNNGKSQSPALIERAREHLPSAQPWQAAYSSTGNTLALSLPASSLPQTKNISLFFEERGLVNNSADARVEYTEDRIVIRQTTGEIEANTVPRSKAIITAGAKAFAVEATFSPDAPPPETVTAADAPTLTLATALVFALLGGIILNLMPCVFPILSLKIFGLVQLKGAERAKARLHGLAYTAGILTSFLSIAGLLIALKAGGAHIGWGFQLQNPLVIVFLVYLTALLGLNLAGFFEINTAFANLGTSLTRSKGLGGSFFTGVLATLVATPCTAPFMGAAMGYALIQPPHVALGIFATLGLGLALPYLAFSLVPALHVLLPKPGAWMLRFKEFLAFPMFATSAWLLWVLSQQAGNGSILFTLLGLTVLGLGIWWLKHSTPRSLGRALAMLVLVFGLAPFYLIRPAAETITYQDFTPAAYREALSSGDPVFVNMTAAWCITCHMNERVALNTSATRTLFQNKRVRYLKGDWTNFNADITRYLERYQRNGVPLYVFYPAPIHGKRPAPVILPQILTPDLVHDTLEQN